MKMGTHQVPLLWEILRRSDYNDRVACCFEWVDPVDKLMKYENDLNRILQCHNMKILSRKTIWLGKLNLEMSV